MRGRLRRDRWLLAILLVALLLPYLGASFGAVGQVAAASACYYLAAVTHALAVIIVLIGVLEGLSMHPEARRER